jgi:hypothetical protein
VHGLGDDVDHGLRSGNQGSVVCVVGMNSRVHAFGHELLRDRVDHPVFLGDQVPGRAVLPPGFRHRLLDALHGNWSLHRSQYRMFFGSPLLGEVGRLMSDRCHSRRRV